MANKFLAGVVIVGAALFGGCDDKPARDLEDILVEPVKVVKVDESVDVRDRDIGEFNYLNVYDDVIEENVLDFNKKHNINLDSDLIRAMIVVEAGVKRFRDESKWDNAFDYDPMQIANVGDYALRALADGKEDTKFVGDFSRLRGKRNTPRGDGAWDYSNTNLTAEDSIYGGIGWLLNQAVENIEVGPIIKYEVKSGDNLSRIAAKNGSTLETLKRINDINYDNLKIGQEINFMKASRTFNPDGIDWEHAVKDYNGGGDSNYVLKVFGAYEKIKEARK